MKIENLCRMPANEFAGLEKQIKPFKTLGDVLKWAGVTPDSRFVQGIVSEVYTQDEYTHDVIVPYSNYFLVFDTT